MVSKATHHIARSAVFLGAALVVSAVQADTFDVTFCGSNSITQTLLDAKDLTIATFEGKGTVRSNPEGKAFDNGSFHLLGTSYRTGDKVSRFGYSRYLDADGDFVVQENVRPAEGTDSTWKFLYGTGKWQGIKGSGKTTVVLAPKPIAAGTVQQCLRSTGVYELPKK